uniref:Reverse transcriptase domain-containing protein n=1 Tax=Tanacetum cinerariifolium TaxID=118510 RepID=A0A6L2JQX9_TANCI|nr:reverse transcriptase domain-containing protein [Tanacetum cinerariifolium]
MATEGNGDPPVPDLWTMKELCQPTLNGRGRPIASISIQATNFGLKNDMIQQVQIFFQFHGLSGDDANKHLNKFLHVTKSIKVNGVTDDALRLYLFPHSLTHHATALFDRFLRNSINTFEQMEKMILGKYFPPSMVTKLRNEITNFRQHPDESLFEAWEHYKLSIDHSLKAEMAEINKNLMKVLQINQQVKAVTPSCETFGGPHSYNDCLATVGQTQNVYAVGAYQGGTLPSNTITNSKEDLKGITTRSGNAYQGPTFPTTSSSSPPKVVERETEVTKDTVPPTNDGSTKDVQPPANDAILKNMKTNMTSLTNSNIELKNMFGQFMKMNTASSSGSRTLLCNTITNLKEDLKGITTQSRTAYQGPTIPTTSSSFPKVVERETERFDESFSEAWDKFKDILRACRHHGFSKLHQLDTFYNALNSKDQDSLNSAVGGNVLDKMPRECLAIIESKSRVHYSRNKPVVAKVSTNTSTSSISPDVAELKDMVKALLLDKKSQNQAPATVKSVEESCVTCGGAHSYRNCLATDGNVYRDNIQEFVSQAFAFNYNQGNTSYRPPMMSNQIRPPDFHPIPNNQNAQLNQRNNQNPPASQTQGVLKEDFSAYVKANDAVMRNMRTQGQNMQNQKTNLTDLLTKFVNSNNATLPSNTIANPKSDLKAITTRSEATKDTVHPTNNESIKDVQPLVVQTETPAIQISKPISEPVNSPVSAPRPNQRPSIPYPPRMQDQKLRDKANYQREKFFQIFKDLNYNISFADALILMPNLGRLGASIKLMPLSVWNKLSLPDLTSTCMTLELADRSISRPVGVAEDVYVKMGTFHFPVNFVVVDFDADPQVPLILGRSFLKTGRALIDVFNGELTLRFGKEAITFNLDQTSTYSANYNDMMAKRIDIDLSCKEYSQEVLGFSDLITSGNPTPYYDLIVSTTSPTLNPFGNSDFLLEEVDASLAIEDDPTLPEVDQSYLDSEGDILLLEAFINDDPSLPPPNQGNHLPELEYTFLEGDDKFPVIITKDLSVEEKTAFIIVLNSHKRAIAWKLSDIKGIDPEFCIYKILMEEDFESAVQHQRRVNPKTHDVIKQEVLKLLDAGLICPISDSPWVSPVHCVPKKGGFTVIENEDNELILTCLVTGWRVYIDYCKLNEATHKDHFPLPFMDQTQERLAGNQYYCFLDGFSGYFQIPIDPKDQEKTTFTCPYGTFAYRRMPFGLCNAPDTFQRKDAEEV